MIISSPKNSQIKTLKQLRSKSRYRIKDKCFVVEGLREIEMALNFGYKFLKIYIADGLYQHQLHFPEEIEIIQVSKEVYEHLAYRSSTEGIVGLVESPSNHLKTLNFKRKNPLVLVLETPEKPGNIGAVLRTADAAQVDAVIIANPKTDLYNPNTIRASLGAIFSTPLAVGSSEEVFQYLTDLEFHLFAATLQNSNSYLEESYQGSTAFIMGSEAKGLSSFWREKPNIKTINIPMLGEIDSMNLSVSTAILTFEAVRQRHP